MVSELEMALALAPAELVLESVRVELASVLASNLEVSALESAAREYSLFLQAVL